jgi:hypothetical protein
MIQAYAFLCLLLSSQESSVPDQESAGHQIEYALPDSGHALVPFRLVRNQVRIAAKINGVGPFQLVLDTGMPTSDVLLLRSLRLDGLKLTDSGASTPLVGAGGAGQERSAVVVEKGVSITLGELAMSGVRATVLPDHAGFPTTIDGIIGGALFDRFVVHLDMGAGQMELVEPSGWSPPEGASVLPLIRVPGAAFVEVRVAVGDEEPAPAQVVIDLGASHAISLNRRADGSLAPPAKTIDAALGRGLSGVVHGVLGRIRRLEIGPFSFENVVAAFPVAEHQHSGGLDFRDGNLGAEILKRFDVSFDYRSSRMVLSKNKLFGEPFEHDMSGLELDWLEDGTLSVRSVLAGSPAADAGIQPEDLLLGIGQRSLDALSEDEIRDALRGDGKEVQFLFRRGPKVFMKRLRLRRLV